MAKAIVVREHGGPEVLKLEDVQCAEPGPGEAKVRQAAIGLNFIDIYFRTGFYPAPNGLPLTPGGEGAGEIVSVGEGVKHLRPGDRVAYAINVGAYAEERLIPADRLVKVPDEVSLETAAAMMLKGMTVEYLLNRTFPVKKGDTVLFHAAAGGVGLIAGQWAKSIGATIIGTVGSKEKAGLAIKAGYDHIINYRESDFVDEVRAITGGRGVDVVYDSVGKDTFPASLDCIRPRGMWVSFGQSSGPAVPLDINLLSKKGSLYATRPTLFAYVAAREELEASAAALFDKVRAGEVTIAINQRYRLADAAQAHRDLEARKTTGTTLLIP
ncbi:quinone oxidoreductase family protein [Pararhizobium haloflavum]|uniref:quinone oxidoreductase family protein n=1 Tax=Pararhizobium haloflavum TaxID=2037914 RepID=UPI000C1A5AB2|nr:quinone oxidoreductase [Pararhizobium haloflavum]